MRGAIYVDGFNLYHAISDLGMPHLKWLDLWRLGSLIARGHARTLRGQSFVLLISLVIMARGCGMRHISMPLEMLA